MATRQKNKNGITQRPTATPLADPQLEWEKGVRGECWGESGLVGRVGDKETPDREDDGTVELMLVSIRSSNPNQEFASTHGCKEKRWPWFGSSFCYYNNVHATYLFIIVMTQVRAHFLYIRI